MEEAMKAVQKGDIGINQAAREYGVPRTTLKDRVSGRVKHGTKSGPHPYLSVNEETELAKFVKQCAEVGYGKTYDIAQSVANEKGILRKTQISPQPSSVTKETRVSPRTSETVHTNVCCTCFRTMLKTYWKALVLIGLHVHVGGGAHVY